MRAQVRAQARRLHQGQHVQQVHKNQNSADPISMTMRWALSEEVPLVLEIMYYLLNHVW